MFIKYNNDVDRIMVIVDTNKLDAMWAILNGKARTLRARFRVANASEAAESVIAYGNEAEIINAFNNLSCQLNKCN